MSISMHLTNIFLYFGNYLCHLKAKVWYSVCLAKCIRFICSKTRRHNSKYKCYCFKYQVCGMLVNVLFSRGHLRLMSIITTNNYMMSGKCIQDFFRKKGNGKSWENNRDFFQNRNNSTVLWICWRRS